jgi:hypothetical protein
MTAWTGNIVGMAGEGKYEQPNNEYFQRPLRPDLYNKYSIQSAQAQGLIAIVYIPKSVTVAASDTFTLTVKA